MRERPRDPPFDVLIVGTGPAGLAAAAALATVGADVAIAGPPLPPSGIADGRTAALFGGSIDFLVDLGVWPALAARSAAIHGIRLIDDTGGLLRAPELIFQAAEIGRTELGYNVPNRDLTTALYGALTANPRVAILATPAVTGLEPADDHVKARLDDGRLVCARLLVAADGRQSICRAAVGIGVRAWRYDQSALVATFSHDRPHEGISNEFHRLAGPMTTVPMPGAASSLVWVETPQTAERLAGLSDAVFLDELSRHLHGVLGGIGRVEPRRLFPLSGLRADRYGQSRVALVGEAAHVIPPIGAQGLNLGLRDAAGIAACVSEAKGSGGDCGSDALLDRYHGLRDSDITARTFAVDLLNRSLISGLAPVHLARGAGLHLLRAVPAFKRALIHQGLGPSHTALVRSPAQSFSPEHRAV